MISFSYSFESLFHVISCFKCLSGCNGVKKTFLILQDYVSERHGISVGRYTYT